MEELHNNPYQPSEGMLRCKRKASSHISTNTCLQMMDEVQCAGCQYITVIEMRTKFQDSYQNFFRYTDDCKAAQHIMIDGGCSTCMLNLFSSGKGRPMGYDLEKRGTNQFSEKKKFPFTEECARLGHKQFRASGSCQTCISKYGSQKAKEKRLLEADLPKKKVTKETKEERKKQRLMDLMIEALEQLEQATHCVERAKVNVLLVIREKY